MPGEPGDLRGHVARIQVASAELSKPLGSDSLRRLVTLRTRASIHPDEGGAERLARGVGCDEAVQLRSERDGADGGAVDGPADLCERLGDGSEPLACVLLRPAGLGIRERVGHVGLRDLGAVGVVRLGAGALRSDVDSDHQLRRHSAPSESSPGPRR